MAFVHPRTTPTPPEAWLAVYSSLPEPEYIVYRVCQTPEEAEAFAKDCYYAFAKARATVALIDDPALPIRHLGLSIANAACLTARDNWILRYRNLLDGLLTRPKAATFFTYQKENLIDPLSTYRAPAEGPCPMPTDLAWPNCSQCGEMMAFLGVLDFRNAFDSPAPRGSLVLHKCADWGCYERECSSAIWIMPGDAYVMQGGALGSPVLIGQTWQTTDYEFDFDKLDAVFRKNIPNERSAYGNPISIGDKVGGHFFFIQGEPRVVDSRGRLMICIGQITGCEYIELGDCGSGYIFWSPKSGEMAIEFQDY